MSVHGQSFQAIGTVVVRRLKVCVRVMVQAFHSQFIVWFIAWGSHNKESFEPLS